MLSSISHLDKTKVYDVNSAVTLTEIFINEFEFLTGLLELDLYKNWSFNLRSKCFLLFNFYFRNLNFSILFFWRVNQGSIRDLRGSIIQEVKTGGSTSYCHDLTSITNQWHRVYVIVSYYFSYKKERFHVWGIKYESCTAEPAASGRGLCDIYRV